MKAQSYILLFFLFFSCCQSKYKTEFTQIVLPDSTVFRKCIVDYLNEEMNGSIKCYRDSILIYEARVSKNVLHGSFERFDSLTGDLSSQGTYKYGNKILDFYEYHNDSIISVYEYYDSLTFDPLYGVKFDKEGFMTDSFLKFILKSKNNKHQRHKISEFSLELSHSNFDSTVIALDLEHSDNFAIGQREPFIPNGGAFFIELLDTGWIDLTGKIIEVGIEDNNHIMGAEQSFEVMIYVESTPDKTVL